MSKIVEGLNRLFENHRIVLWYDEDQELTQQYEKLDLLSVTKLTVENNEFALKHQMLLKEPKQKFLLYLPYARPENDENWLLDIELSNQIFHTDQEALILQELGLGYHFRPWVKKHLEFFKTKGRLKKFAQNLKQAESEEQLTYSLLQVVMGATSDHLSDLIRAYAIAFAEESNEIIDKDLKRFNLFDAFWEMVEANYNYRSKNQSIYDFILEVFQKNFTPLASKASVNSSAEVVLASWKDARSFEETFKILAHKVEEDLNIKQLIGTLPVEDLLHEDVFECIDQYIIKELSIQIEQETLNNDKTEQMLKQREATYWQERYAPFYKSLQYATWLIFEVNKHQNIEITDYNDGLKQYTSQWFLIDQYYRLFIENYRATNQNNVLNALFQKVHKVYSNSWLIKLSENWQDTVDKSNGWYFGANSQKKFFNRDVKIKYLEKKTKLFVVISDALRYECGQQLHEFFNERSRFTSKLEYQVTGLPSYTQLGMASLLPHQELSFGKGDEIKIDGNRTSGKVARKKILQDQSGVSSTTMLAEDLMRLASRGKEAQDLIQNHDLIYVYHNRIDKVGDDKTSEDKVIEASKEEIDYLMEVVKKITNMNGNHVIITADHGFVYQHEVLDESDFADGEIEGDVVKGNRRFVIGTDLTHNHNVVKYSAKSLHIQNDVDVLIPKGINRLRNQGSGSRFVHGGSTLQETVVPVLFIAKKRADTVEKVDVDILNKANNRITTNLHGVKFYQQQAVSAKYVSRTVKCYFAVLDGDKNTPISDVFTYTFDSESTRAEEREVQKRFTISTNLKRSQNVFLMVEEKVKGSNKWNVLSKFPYTLSLAMENDFDDF